MSCNDCIHNDVCERLYELNGIPKIGTTYCGCFKDESRYIELPCKVGDTVYVIEYCRCSKPECAELGRCYKKTQHNTPKLLAQAMKVKEGIRLTLDGWGKVEKTWKPVGTICYKLREKPFTLKMLTEVGKTVFITQEEAERALTERGGQ